MSAAAQARLDARRRERNMPSSSITAVAPTKSEDRHGIQDFQSRLNRGSYNDDRRDNGRGRNGPSDRDRNGGDRRYEGKSWDAAPTPRSVRGGREMEGGSMRVPNKGWDETPRGRGGDGAGRSERRGWDETPRGGRSRDGSPDLQINGKEWEEEQVRLDRDWYSYDDEGAVVSSSSCSPLSYN